MLRGTYKRKKIKQKEKKKRRKDKTSWGWVGPSSAQLGLSLANLIEARASVAVGVIANKAKRDLVSLS